MTTKNMSRIKPLSADEKTRLLALVRERALHDEVSFANEAKREGLEEGREDVARKLIEMNLLTDTQIAAASELTENDIKALRKEIKH
ncbi:hypothetical protein HVA01_03600 [Halovibrio variabilis]|uniref:Uncharacterized protein n=1 Tax=Halovibrio variabilis TaxID=31910 RepID=A0A511UJF7_9GAMM|nr:hypothetical protein [Halovibrio variabilis]GEN26714.1 hypothetical protein HVA01_03600 [Halovibrio variabilis]